MRLPRSECVRLGLDDLEETASLEAACFPLPWSRRQLAAAFGLPNFAAFGLRRRTPDAPLLEAYISLYHGFDEVEILNLAVLPALRRTGRGKRLLRLALRLAGRTGAVRAVLEVHESNIPALALYAGLGFVRIGRRPGYYGAGAEDALVLERVLRTRAS
jgi:ribosomal-protein-alanine N-acetyltransferase